MARKHKCKCGDVVPYIDEFNPTVFPDVVWGIVVRLAFDNERIPRPFVGVMVKQTRRIAHVICFRCVRLKVNEACESGKVSTDLCGDAYIFLTAGVWVKKHYLT